MSTSAHRRLRVFAAHAWHRLGWPGLGGLLCMAGALVLGGQAHQMQKEARRTGLDASPVLAMPAAKESSPGQVTRQDTPPTLPQRADLAALLSQIEQQTRDQGLAWPQAEYRWQPLTSERLGEVELSFTLQGSYPKVRALLNGWLDAQPALALRDLSLRRAHSEVAEVEARIVLVVFLRDGWPHARAWSAPAEAAASAASASTAGEAP